ncbi:signal peptidase I [Streptomyces sp. TRM76130]|nr:signal peptidase I [Streptomyces sp. TRM76130]
MDSESQPTERDRSPRPSDSGTPPDPKAREGRSRFAYRRGRPSSEGPGGVAAWVPGGWFTLTPLVCLVFLLLLSVFVLQPFRIPSGSMERALRIGDRVLVNKLAYRFGAGPQRGDIVVFDGTGTFGAGDYVKRVVGVGGDHVVCCDEEGRIQVNGRSVDESAFLYPGDSPSTVGFDVVVPDGTLFVLGDHRADSSDSRDHLGSPGGGMVPVDDVIGRTDWIVWPFGHSTGLDRPGAYARVPAARDAENADG